MRSVCRHKVDRAIGRPTSRSWDEEQADEDWSSDSDEANDSSEGESNQRHETGHATAVGQLLGTTHTEETTDTRMGDVAD